MRIHLNLHSPGLHLETLLRSEALPELMELIQRHRLEDPDPGLMPSRKPFGRRGPRGRHGPCDDVVVQLDAAALETRERVSAMSVEDLFHKHASPQTFAEKFLVLAAWHEAIAYRDKTKASSGGRTLVQSLVLLGETPPANPPRDVQQAISQGWITRSKPRRLTVTTAGWHHLGELLGSGDDGKTVLV